MQAARSGNIGGLTMTHVWRLVVQRVHFFLKALKVALQSRATQVVNSVLASEAHDQRK
jgi:hypothetical protein